MIRRSFRPGLDGDPERISWRAKGTQSAGKLPLGRFEGARVEPAHRQLVHVVDLLPLPFADGMIHFSHDERLLEARYDRDDRAFSIRWGPGDYELMETAPQEWEQIPPKADMARANDGILYG